MPAPPTDPVEVDTVPPETCDVIAVGGGIIGCATARELVERGASVTLLEKGAHRRLSSLAATGAGRARCAAARARSLS